MVTISVENLLRQQREEGYLLPLPQASVIKKSKTTIVPYGAFNKGFPVYDTLGVSIQHIIQEAGVGLINAGINYLLERPVGEGYRSSSKIEVAMALGDMPIHEQMKYLEDMIEAGERKAVMTFLKTIVDVRENVCVSLNGRTIVLAYDREVEEEIMARIRPFELWDAVPEWFVDSWLRDDLYDSIVDMEDFEEMAIYDIGSAWDIAQLVYECHDTFNPYGEYAVMRDGVLRSYNEMKTYAREFYEEDLLSLISYGVNSSEDEELREVGTKLLQRVEEITGFIINM